MSDNIRPKSKGNAGRTGATSPKAGGATRGHDAKPTAPAPAAPPRRSGTRSPYFLPAFIAVIGASFLFSYNYAVSASTASDAQAQYAFDPSSAAAQDSGGGAAGGGGCACCGGSSEPIEKETKVAGDVQTISVDLSSGGYDPNTIKAKAGVPLEIEFGQGAGCVAQVVVPDFGIQEDLTSGPVTVKLPALEKGEYDFYCGMQMVFGKIVVE